MKYDMLYYIGRFQYLHNGHIQIIENALSQAKYLLILIGSSNRSVSPKNPFSAEERESMIRAVAKNRGWEDRLIIDYIPDVTYSRNKDAWYKDVKNLVAKAVFNHPKKIQKVGMIGHDKDASTFYLRGFDNVDFVQQPNFNGYNSTTLREMFFKGEPVGTDLSHPEVIRLVTKWKQEHLDVFDNLVEEITFIDQYQKDWPDTIYNTGDALVTCNGHILLVRRKNFPGRGLWAMPGGFVNPNELFIDAAKRELNEETMFDGELVLKSCELFDAIGRDPRRRIVSKVFHFDVAGSTANGKTVPFPFVKAADDAASAQWVKISDAINSPREFFIDHWFIMMYMLGYR